METSM